MYRGALGWIWGEKGYLYYSQIPLQGPSISYNPTVKWDWNSNAHRSAEQMTARSWWATGNRSSVPVLLAAETGDQLLLVLSFPQGNQKSRFLREILNCSRLALNSNAFRMMMPHKSQTSRSPELWPLYCQHCEVLVCIGDPSLRLGGDQPFQFAWDEGMSRQLSWVNWDSWFLVVSLGVTPNRKSWWSQGSCLSSPTSENTHLLYVTF